MANNEFSTLEKEFDPVSEKYCLKYEIFNEETCEVEEQISYFDSEEDMESFISENSAYPDEIEESDDELLQRQDEDEDYEFDSDEDDEEYE